MARTETAQTETGRTETGRTETGRTETGRTETGPNETGATTTASETVQTASEPNETAVARTGKAWTTMAPNLEEPNSEEVVRFGKVRGSGTSSVHEKAVPRDAGPRATGQPRDRACSAGYSMLALRDWEQFEPACEHWREERDQWFATRDAAAWCAGFPADRRWSLFGPAKSRSSCRVPGGFA
jgi:hypothetical protein